MRAAERATGFGNPDNLGRCVTGRDVARQNATGSSLTLGAHNGFVDLRSCVWVARVLQPLASKTERKKMQPPIRRYAFSIAILASFALTPRAALADCQKDTDCKGDRVCEQGQCVSPENPPPLPSAPAAPPALYYAPDVGQSAPPPAMQTFTDTPLPGQKKGKGLLITGIVFLSMAVVHSAVIAGIAASGEGEDLQGALIANGVLGTGSLVTGVVMVSVGAVRMRRSAAAYEPQLAGTQISAGPGLVVGVRGSF